MDWFPLADFDKTDLPVNVDWWCSVCERRIIPEPYRRLTADGWQIHRDFLPSPLVERLEAYDHAQNWQ